MSVIVSLLWWLLALVLSLVFLVLFVATLLIFQVNDTFLEPDFYIKQLRKADAYNFLYDEAIPVLLEESTQDNQDAPVDLTVVEDEVIEAARKAIPPEWIQAQVEQIIQEMIPYLRGDTSSFEVTVPLADRIAVAGDVVKETLRQGTTFPRLYDELVESAADEVLESSDTLPFGLDLSQQDIVFTIESAAPKEWLLDQADHVIDQAVPYLSGRSEQFAITIPLAERVDASVEAIKELVRKGNTYQFLIDEAVTPAVEQNLSQVVQLPFGVSLTVEEVLEAFQQVITEEWVQARLVDILDTGVDYLTGRTETLRLAIPLADRKAVALEAVTELVERKLETLLTGLPECTLEGLQQLAPGPSSIPTCRPPGVTYEQAKALLDIQVAPTVQQAIGEQIPDQWLYTEEQMRSTMGEDSWDIVQRAREWVSKGITFTDADLRDMLDPEDQDTLDDVLDITRNGFTFTEADLRERLEEEGAEGQEQFEEFDHNRSYIQRARGMLFLLPVILAILLVVIGFLGGRGWWGRLRVASAVLTIAAGLVLLAVVLLTNRAETFLLDLVPQDDTYVVLVDKAREIAISLAEDIFGGLRSRTLVLAIVGGSLFVFSIIGGVRFRARRGAPP